MISIVIPAYNEEKYIGKTLDSILAAKKNYQDPKSIEIIVVNNCSSDKTVEIVKSKGAQIVNEEKRCIASVRNK
ncbi:MAG: glycosyltransferase family 2 protein, partial [Nanoarchaeota archaeon]